MVGPDQRVSTGQGGMAVNCDEIWMESAIGLSCLSIMTSACPASNGEQATSLVEGASHKNSLQVIRVTTASNNELTSSSTPVTPYTYKPTNSYQPQGSH